MRTTRHVALTVVTLAVGLSGLQVQNGTAATPVPAWVQRYNGPANAADGPTAIAVDSSNNVIVTGYSYGASWTWDYATIKYSSAGVPLWTNRFNGPENQDDSATAVAVDGNGNVFVTGYSYVTNYPFNVGDYVTIAYSSSGAPLWTNRYDGPGNGDDEARAIAVDGNGNVLVTGQSSGSGSSWDYATIKYSNAGVALWTNRYNGPGNDDDEAWAIAVDGSRNVFVTGGSYEGGVSDAYATIKYSCAGVPLWTNRYVGPGKGGARADAIAVDGSGNVFVTGWTGITNGPSDYTTIAYSSSGVPLWANHYNGSANNSDLATGIALDGSGNVFVTGHSYGNGTHVDYATIAYSSTGVPLWTNRFNGTGNSDDFAEAIVVNADGNVLVTGSVTNSGRGYEYATIEYSNTGVPLWTNLYDGLGSGGDGAWAFALDKNGNLIVTGSSMGSGSGYDFATIKYVLPPSLTALAQPDRAFKLRVDDPAQAPTLVVEASTNLRAWAPVFTNTTPTNVLFYTDTGAGGYLGRFYRASQRW